MNARLGVTGPERMVIRLVGKRPGISPRELARTLHVRPSTLAELLERLVRRDVIARITDAADARRALLTLTAKGAAVDAIQRGTVEAAVRSALAGLARRDIETAAAVLGALKRAFDK